MVQQCNPNRLTHSAAERKKEYINTIVAQYEREKANKKKRHIKTVFSANDSSKQLKSLNSSHTFRQRGDPIELYLSQNHFLFSFFNLPRTI